MSTALFQPFSIAKRGGQVEAFCIPRGSARLSRTQIKSLAGNAASTSEKAFWAVVDGAGWSDSSIKTPFSAEIKADINTQLGAASGDVIIMVASPPRVNVRK